MIILSSYLDAIVPNKPILILTSHHQVSQTPRTTLPFSLKRSILLQQRCSRRPYYLSESKSPHQ